MEFTCNMDENIPHVISPTLYTENPFEEGEESPHDSGIVDHVAPSCDYDGHDDYSDDDDPPSRPTSRLGFNVGVDSGMGTLDDGDPSLVGAPAPNWAHSPPMLPLPHSSRKSPCPIGEDIHISPKPDHHHTLGTISVLPPSLSSVISEDDGAFTPITSGDEDVDSDDIQSDCSSCTSSDDDLLVQLPCKPCSMASTPAPPPPAPKPKSKSVSRLAFPFTSKQSPRPSSPSPSARSPTPRRSPPPPPPRRKYSLLPSPLSSNSPTVAPPSPARHIYSEHGYSRHALTNLKWFWSTREDEWDLYAARTADAAQFGERSILAEGTPQPPRYGSPRTCSSNLDPVPPPSIHPRRGDVTALRDPYCMQMDQCLATLPVWTIAKTLWMYDLHVATRERERELEEQRELERDEQQALEEDGYDGEESETESAVSLRTSPSTDFGDDSDTTLVESESEGDLTRLVEREVVGKGKGKHQEGSDTYENPFMDEHEKYYLASGCCADGSGSAGPSTRASCEPECPLSPLLSTSSSKINSPSVCASPYPSYQSNIYLPCLGSIRSYKPPWNTNWYRRWELIAELMCRDQEYKQALFSSLSPGPLLAPLDSSSAPSLSVPASKFFIAGDAEEAGDEVWSEVWEVDSEHPDEDMLAHKSPLTSKMTAGTVSLS